MAVTFELDDFQQGYVDMVRYVAEHGEQISPRGIPTREVRNATILVADPTRALAVDVGRALPLKIVAVEAIQLVAGVSDLAQLDAVSGGRFSQFSDDGFILAGAYGPRIANQLPYVVEVLAKDPASRQAGVSIWDQETVGLPSKDVPCTVSMFFDIRNDRLNMTVTMRSSDAWLGMPIDVPVFTHLQRCLAWALDVGVGEYVHHSRSLHLYEQDLERVTSLHHPVATRTDQMPCVMDGYHRDRLTSTDLLAMTDLSWRLVRATARHVSNQSTPVNTDATRWFADRMPSALPPITEFANGYVIREKS